MLPLRSDTLLIPSQSPEPLNDHISLSLASAPGSEEEELMQPSLHRPQPPNQRGPRVRVGRGITIATKLDFHEPGGPTPHHVLLLHLQGRQNSPFSSSGPPVKLGRQLLALFTKQMQGHRADRRWAITPSTILQLSLVPLSFAAIGPGVLALIVQLSCPDSLGPKEGGDNNVTRSFV
eukprot:9842332-Alexandrium_andersonii.AAC.1